jgi:hypothetical protein
MMIHLIGTATALLHPPYRTPISAAQQTIAQRNDLPLGLVIPANRAAVLIRESKQPGRDRERGLRRTGIVDVDSQPAAPTLFVESLHILMGTMSPCETNKMMGSTALRFRFG